MKGTIKRFTSLMLALLMTLALLPMEVLAAENVSDFTQLTELTSEAQIASTPAIQPLADAATRLFRSPKNWPPAPRLVIQPVRSAPFVMRFSPVWKKSLRPATQK